MRSHFLPASTGTKTKRSHLISGAAIACAAVLIPSIGAAQVAYDSAANSTYAGGWSAGQDGGYGFGAWSFDGTTSPGGVSDPGAQQVESSSLWTLFNLGTAPPSGISDVGRAITEPGGLQVGQTFQTIIENPVGYHFYGGYDILFYNGTDNNAAGNNAAALRVGEFDYYTTYPYWTVSDAGPGTTTTLSSENTAGGTAVAGMQLDFTLTSATGYSLTLTPLGGGAAYSTTGTLASSLPIDYVNFRLYDGTSSGPNDTADNFEIENMEIVVPEPTSVALLGLGLGGLMFLRRKK